MSYQTSYGFNSFGLGLRPTPMVRRLLIANAVFFALWLAAPRFVFEWFAFQPARIALRPWSPLTYMFVHAGLGHLFFNMLMLFFFGPPLEARWGEREFLKFYVICGLGGAALSFLFLPASIVGASGALYGIMLAFAMNWPNVPIYVFGIFPVPAKYLVGFMALASLLSAVDSTQGGSDIAHLAHLGGLVAGFLYLKADWRTGKAMEGIQRAATKKRRLAIVPREEAEEEAIDASRGRFPAEEAKLYDRVDAVLDKISAEGMDALTASERELLDEVSRRHRTN
jgi:membrane associated rhomboid family serine protease